MNQKKKSMLQQKWIDLYSGCSFDGFKHIFEQRKFWRLFWLIIVLAATTLAIFLFEGAIRDFFSYKTTTSYEYLLDNTQVNFPTITLCNINSVSKRKLENNTYNLTQSELVDFYQKIHEGTLNISDANTIRILTRMKDNNIDTLDKLFRRYEYTLTEMLADSHINTVTNKKPCIFSGYECNMDDFTEIISAKYGLCYQFNSIYLQYRLVAKKAGEGTGLKLFLNIPEDDLLVSNEPYSGLFIFIHPYGEPFESTIANRIPIATGSMNFVYMTLYQRELLKHPYHSNCSSKSFKLVSNKITYSQSMCKVDCVMQKMAKKCGCVATEFIHHLDDGSLVCPVEKLQCTEEFTVNLASRLSQCTSDCPAQCSVLSYATTTGATSMTTTKSVRLLSQAYNMTDPQARQYISHNFFGIDIFFTDLVYIKETLSPAQNWVTLLSQIGGSLGLAMGCSIITFIEFIVFGLYALYTYCKYKDDDDNGTGKKPEQNGVKNHGHELSEVA